jgi:hypothetical protein
MNLVTAPGNPLVADVEHEVLGHLALVGDLTGPQPVGAENLCHQSIFMNHATSAVAPPDAELVQVGDAIWQPAERCWNQRHLMTVLREYELTSALVVRSAVARARGATGPV